MKCNVLLDLLPLYIDGCCSEESKKTVKEHLAACSDCQRVYAAMSRRVEVKETKTPAVKLRRVEEWKASILQSIVLFVSFAIITLGVALEAATPTGADNGQWAFALVIPATGNLLSLVNWYFVRLYRSRKAFSNCSCLITLLIITAGYIWAMLHYAGGAQLTSALVIMGGVLSTVFVILSKFLSHYYARFLGRA